jgi:hypothetical protein
MARTPGKPRKTMERYGGTPDKRRIVRRAAADVRAGREDTECRGKPMSRACPTPATRRNLHGAD